MSNISEVIGWKFDYQGGMNTDDGVITAFPGGIPSQADQDKWTAEYEAHIASTQYQRDRAESYASIPDQLDYIYHHGVEKWKENMILPIKNKYPKEIS
jgi:formylmethanofuran:tetrahydromethanopterin formyltransferase